MDLTRIVLPGMLERGRGHIVNMASLAGKVPPAYLASYCRDQAWRGRLHPRAASREWRRQPVGFSAICPGFVSRVGMFGRLEHRISAPRVLGTVPPESVGDAVVRAIRKNLAEVIVNNRPVRPLILLNALAPRVAGRVWRAPSPCGSSRRDTRGPAIASSGTAIASNLPPPAAAPGRKSTARFASIGGPEKGGGPNLSHMFLGTPEVQGR